MTTRRRKTEPNKNVITLYRKFFMTPRRRKTEPYTNVILGILNKSTISSSLAKVAKVLQDISLVQRKIVVSRKIWKSGLLLSFIIKDKILPTECVVISKCVLNFELLSLTFVVTV